MVLSNFTWSDASVYTTEAKVNSESVTAIIYLGSTGIVISKRYLTKIGVTPDAKIQLALTSIIGAFKQTREFSYELNIQVGQARVKLPAIVIEGLFVDLLLRVNWIKERRRRI